MTPILNLFADFFDKYIVHIPEDQKDQFRKDAAAAGEAILKAAPGIAEAGAKGAAEGLSHG